MYKQQPSKKMYSKNSYGFQNRWQESIIEINEKIYY